MPSNVRREMPDNGYLQFREAIKAAILINDEDKRDELVDHLVTTLKDSVETRTERGIRMFGHIVSILIAAAFSVLLIWLLYDSYQAENFDFFRMLISSSLAGIVIGGVATYFMKK